MTVMRWGWVFQGIMWQISNVVLLPSGLYLVLVSVSIVLSLINFHEVLLAVFPQLQFLILLISQFITSQFKAERYRCNQISL